MVSILARAVAVLVVASCCGANAQAQRLVVDIRDATLKSGVAGAVITVVEQRTGARVFGLANESGRASLKLPAAGAWAVSVRRIGIVPSGAAAVHVDTAQTVSVSIAVTSTRFTLPSVRVTAVAGSCGRAPRGDDRTSALWEQVTLALRASTLTRAETVAAPALRVQMFERVLDRSRKRLKEQPLRSGTGAGRPFFAADPDSLARFGYVRRERDGSFHYFAPDEVVLLSESFVKTHCFDSPASDADPRLAELRFRPVPDRTLPDVAGTAFVDTTTGELRRIEFRFVNVDQLFNSGRPEAGGDVALRQLRNGQWIVSDWTLRMPTFLRVPWRAESTVAGYREVGGTIDVVDSPPAVPLDSAVPRTVGTAPVQPALVESLPRRRAVEPASADSVPTRDRIYQFGRIDGFNLSGRRITVSPSQPERPRDARQSSDGSAAGAGEPRRDGITARMVEIRSEFALRRHFGVGVFLDSAALARSAVKTAAELALLVTGVMQFQVPANVPPPPADDDIDLAREWRDGAELPMMPLSGADSATSALCLVKFVLDGKRASVSELSALPAREIAVLEFYRRPRDVPDAFRRPGNRCGTALLWSYADDRLSR